ncbi:uncharacterized protein LOC130552310 [Triplophysa rosa]|uniref:uncharacterized protein LOC130552310 n=1 Tax=Triplophysa rosa TaxID=992332 RepID=UPI0025462469|nr:uncharacterized protein LOC130552310 [Triplophysa rosa]
MEESKGSFKGQRNSTGHLNITNIRRDQSGEYEVNINGRSLMLRRTFRINVTDEMQTESVMEGEFVILHTNTEKQADDVIKWKFEDTLIAQFNRTANNFSYDDPNGRFRERLTLDRGGSLTIRKLNTEDSGHYGVNITSSKHIIHKRFNVTVTVPSLRSQLETNGSGLLVVGFFLGIIVTVVIIGVSFMVYKRCSRGLNKNKKNEASEHLNQQSSNTNSI